LPERPGLPRRALAELLAAFGLIFCGGGGAAEAASGHATRDEIAKRVEELVAALA
jgi:hypothetical protein